MGAGTEQQDGGVQEQELLHVLPDGTKLYMHKWIPSQPPLAKLLFVHGFSDHCMNYYDLFPSLARRRIQVTGYDQRGFGRTSLPNPSMKGRTGPTTTVLGDLAHVLETTQFPSPEIPVFLMGHSMGGAELLTLCSTPKYEPLVSQIAGIILHAPWLGLTPQEAPAAIKVAAGRLAARLMPHFQLVNAVAPEKVTHDPAVAQKIREDELCHDTGTLEGFASMLDRSANLRNGVVKLSPKLKAMFLLHGSGDYLIDYNDSKRYFETQTSAVLDREFRTYEGWNHLLHADFVGSREIFADDVAGWILRRSAGAKEFVPEGERQSVLAKDNGGLYTKVTDNMWKG